MVSKQIKLKPVRLSNVINLMEARYFLKAAYVMLATNLKLPSHSPFDALNSVLMNQHE